LGGMKGITYTQVAQYVVLIIAYTIPAVFISLQLTGNAIPSLGMFGTHTESGLPLLEKLNQVVNDLGFQDYTADVDNKLNMLLFTLSLMIGTAGLPHVIIRFFTVPKVADARWSAGWARVFIAMLYLTAPAVGSMARLDLMNTVYPEGTSAPALEYAERPEWIKTWEETGLGECEDNNSDGRSQVYNDNKDNCADTGAAALEDAERLEWIKTWEETGLVKFEDKNSDGRIQVYNDKNANFADTAAERGWNGNELTVNNDIMVLANPEIAGLPGWVIGLI